MCPLLNDVRGAGEKPFPAGSIIVDVNFTDFLIEFSSALDLLSPESGHHGVRRAYIAANIARQRNFTPQAQKRLFIAALLWDLGKTVHSPAGCGKRFAGIPLLADSAELIVSRGNQHPECRLLDLADNLHLLTLHEFPRDNYPVRAIETLCDSIGSRYLLDDVLALRDLGISRQFWKDLASDKLHEQVATFSPLSDCGMSDDDLEQLASLLAGVIDKHCQSTRQHSFEVADTSALLAELYGFSPKGIVRIRIAGLLHDLGKLILPASLLNKVEPLSDFERRRIQIHPQFTWKILSRISGMHDIARMAGFHHERPDGNGYPFRLRGTQLDLGPRIVAVADHYSALREVRSYKKAFSPEECFRMMQKIAEQGGLDPEVVTALQCHVTGSEHEALCAFQP